MITDLPNSEDYKSQGREWLLQSFDIVYDYSEELEYLEDWKDSDWHFHKGKLSTVLVLIHQAIESVLKSEIIQTSPYLLIDLASSSWPTLPKSTDKSFNELYTINSEALLRVFCATSRLDKNKKELVKIFEEIRIKRNQIVHGIHKEILKPEYLINLQFKVSREFFEANFWNLMKEEEKNHPLYNELEEEDLITELYARLKLIEKHLSKRKFQNLMNIEGRGYLCLSCTQHSQDWDLKTVFLQPNGPNSKKATCIICDETYRLIRENCWNKDCKGNVIHLDTETDWKTCLTCLEASKNE